MVPTYEDPADAPDEDALAYRRDWRWLNTVNRVCSGVKKVRYGPRAGTPCSLTSVIMHQTVIVALVTIPAFSSLTPSQAGPSGGFQFAELENPSCLSRYSVKEVSIKRFIPTRMRD